MGAAKAGNRTVPLTAHSNYGGSHRVDSSACNYFVYLNLNYLNSPNGLEAPSEFEMPVPKRCPPSSPLCSTGWRAGPIVTFVLDNCPCCRAQGQAHSGWSWRGWNFSWRYGHPGKGNIFTLIHSRRQSAFVSEIGNVLVQDVTEAALSCQVHRPLSTRSAPACFSFGAGTWASAVQWICALSASEDGLGRGMLRRCTGS